VQKKTPLLLEPAIIIALENDMHLPSQARDKHRESTQKEEEERHVLMYVTMPCRHWTGSERAR
jgi:hypothetical protein